MIIFERVTQTVDKHHIFRISNTSADTVSIYARTLHYDTKVTRNKVTIDIAKKDIPELIKQLQHAIQK